MVGSHHGQAASVASSDSRDNHAQPPPTHGPAVPILVGAVHNDDRFRRPLGSRARTSDSRNARVASRRFEHASPDVQHLVHAVDSIAVEVERISEGQRFTTQLLAERIQSPQKRAVLPERVITPH